MSDLHRHTEQNRERIGSMLREVRREAGVTQAELARRLGKTQSYITKIEMGLRGIDVPEMQAWASACGHHIDFQIVVRPIGDESERRRAALEHLQRLLPALETDRLEALRRIFSRWGSSTVSVAALPDSDLDLLLRVALPFADMPESVKVPFVENLEEVARLLRAAKGKP